MEEEESASTFLTNMCATKGISVPSSLLKSLKEESKEFVIEKGDVKTFGEEDRYKLMFCVAVFIQSAPKYIKSIKIRDIPIPPALMNTFSVALQKNTQIQEVELTGVGLVDEGLMALCIGLQSNPSITRIDLSGNGITVVGLEYLMDCFEVNLPLSELILSRNAIEEFSVGSILRNAKTLKRLNLSENNLDETGICQVLESLKFNQSLLEVDLRQKLPVKTTKIMYQLCELFLNNRYLKRFWLNAEVPPSLIDKLSTALIGNTQIENYLQNGRDQSDTWVVGTRYGIDYFRGESKDMHDVQNSRWLN